MTQHQNSSTKELPICCISKKIPFDCNCLMCKMWVMSHCQECYSNDNVRKAYSMDEDEGKEVYLCEEHYEELVEA